jgi:hypothetical protein
MNNPLAPLFPGGLSLSTILGVAVLVLTGVSQATGNPMWGAIAGALAGVILPEEPKKPS